MAANHEYIIDSEEWHEYQELRRRETQRRRNPRRRVDIPALLVLLLFAVACGYVLYSRYFSATPVISIAPQRPATAPAMQPAPVAPVSVPAPAVQPAPDTNNPAVSAPDDYQEHSKPSTRSAPPVAEPTARRLCGLCLPRNQPAQLETLVGTLTDTSVQALLSMFPQSPQSSITSISATSKPVQDLATELAARLSY